MSWGAVATIGGSLLASRSAKKSASKAADASIAGSETEAAAQQQALDYLKQREALPVQLRDQALNGLSSVYGLNEPVTQQSLIDRAMQSPLYASIMGTKQGALDDITNRAQATGKGRSGGHAVNLGRESQRIQEQALLTSYMDQLNGIQGFAGLQGNENNIANMTAGIGGTRGMGQIAAGQANQQGQQNAINNMFGFSQLGVAGGAFDGFGGRVSNLFSDIRLKTNIKPAGKRGPFNWYTWEWNFEAKSVGLEGRAEGVLAHEIFEQVPLAIDRLGNFLTVDYTMLAEVARG